MASPGRGEESSRRESAASYEEPDIYSWEENEERTQEYTHDFTQEYTEEYSQEYSQDQSQSQYLSQPLPLSQPSSQPLPQSQAPAPSPIEMRTQGTQTKRTGAHVHGQSHQPERDRPSKDGKKQKRKDKGKRILEAHGEGVDSATVDEDDLLDLVTEGIRRTSIAMRMDDAGRWRIERPASHMPWFS